MTVKAVGEVSIVDLFLSIDCFLLYFNLFH